jgi:ankyrin repeat protein
MGNWRKQLQDAIIPLFLTKDSIDPNSRDRYGQTPLLLAAGNGHEAVVNLLLAEDAVDSGAGARGGPDTRSRDFAGTVILMAMIM